MAEPAKLDDADTLIRAVDVIKRRAEDFGPMLTMICGILTGMADTLSAESAGEEFRAAASSPNRQEEL